MSGCLELELRTKKLRTVHLSPSHAEPGRATFICRRSLVASVVDEAALVRRVQAGQRGVRAVAAVVAVVVVQEGLAAGRVPAHKRFRYEIIHDILYCIHLNKSNLIMSPNCPTDLFSRIPAPSVISTREATMKIVKDIFSIIVSEISFRVFVFLAK